MINPSESKKINVLITGCSSGFGLLTAVMAAQAGFNVIATMRNLNKKDALEKALKKANQTAIIDAMDVTKAEMIMEITNKYAPIDILINNAGIMIAGSIIDITDEEMRNIFETNYFGAVNLIRAVTQQMIETGHGKIINVTSLAGHFGYMFNATYAASKHALIGLTRSIRNEIKSFNIDVVSVEPGFHKTEIINSNARFSENFYNSKSATYKLNRGFGRLMLKIVIPKAGEPERVAKKIIQIMQSDKPKSHYVIGRDAKLLILLRWLGLEWLFEKISYYELLRHKQKANKKKTKQNRGKPKTK